MALAHAIIAALIDCPGSGYDLAKRFSRTANVFWDASHQQIYRELSKLEAAGHVTAETVFPDARPLKKRYCVNQSGKALLIDWMQSPATVSPLKDDLLVKVFSGHLVPPKTLLAELRLHRKRHQLRLTEYQSIEDDAFPDVEVLSQVEVYQHLALRYGLQFEQSWLRWCDEAIATLQALQENHAEDISEESAPVSEARQS